MFKRLLPALLIILLMLGAAAYNANEMLNAKNPDPNHTHADFAVWVGGTQLNFSDDAFMSGSSTDSDTHPTEGLKKYLHLHDGVGTVIHRHKTGLTVADFLQSLGLTATGTCLTLDTNLFSQVDANVASDFALTPTLCDTGKFHWSMYVNGTQIPMNFAYEFSDGDKILLTYDAGDDHTSLFDQITNDACLYSQTCPWRGDPPVENCIADPEVPCVE